MAPRPLPGLFLATLAGILLTERLHLPLRLCAAATILSCLLLLRALHHRHGVVLTAWLCAAAMAGLARGATSLGRPPPTCGAAEDARGLAQSTWRARVDGPIEERAAGMRTIVMLEAEACAGAWVPRRGRAAVSLRPGAPVVRGDLLELTLAVGPVERARNATDPDFEIAALIDGVDATARVLSRHRVIGHQRGLLAWVDEARRAAAHALTARLLPARAAVARGLVMGDRGGLLAADREAWADAGLAHLLAVSGMHVTMIVVAVAAVIRFLLGRVPNLAERVSLSAIAAMAALPPAIWFCLWSASPASALRATIMGGVGLVGTMIGRPGRALDGLSLTGFVMLVEQPLLPHDAGFVLSMAAVAALLALPRLSRLATTVMTSIAATLATVPFTALFFGRVSLVAPLTNLLAVPIGATLATPLAIGLVAVAPFSSTIADALAWPLGVLLGWLDTIVAVGQGLPGASVPLPAPRPWQLALYAGALSSALAGLHPGRHRLGCGVLSLLCLVLLGVVAAVRAGATPNDLVITFPYVGQGDAVVARFPNGATVVVDAGGALTTSDWDPGRQVVAPLLRSSGRATIDLAVVSHPHPDHLGGFAYLARRFAVRELWSNGQEDTHPTLALLREAVRKAGGSARTPAGMGARLWYGGVRIDLLHPREAESGYYPELGLNDNSLVLRLTYGERSILLTGDIEALAEHELVAAGAVQPADVLKVAHHGSRTSSSDAFLDAAAPVLAVASCGVHNSFGFPHAEVSRRLNARGVPLLTTAQHGTVRLTTDGAVWRVRALLGVSQPLRGVMVVDSPGD